MSTMASSLSSAFVKILGKLDPFLRLPVVFAIDSTLNLADLNDMTSLLRTFSGVVMCLPFLLFIGTQSLAFIYGCAISVIVFYSVVLSSIGSYIPIVQHAILETNRKIVIYEGCWCYLAILTMLSAFGKNFIIPRKILIAIPIMASASFAQYKFSWLVGCLFYGTSEILGIGNFLEKAYDDLLYYFERFGMMNTYVYWYQKKNISSVLRLFWLCVVSRFLMDKNAEFSLQWIVASVAASCDSRLRLLSLSFWVPEVSYFVMWVSRGFLNWTFDHTAEDLESRDGGKVVVFFSIACLNFVPDIELVERMIFLSILMFISLSYVLREAFKLIDEALKTLSTSMQDRGLARIRASMLMGFLIWLLFYASYKFCTLYPFHVWQLVVVSSNIVTAMRAISSLALFSLFLYDSQASTSYLDLDDCVYHITALSNSFEFLSTFLVLGFQFVNIYHGTWSYAGLFLIIFHTYFNLWLKARRAWNVFLARRSAAIKVNSLVDATKEQLDQLQDLCPICFDSMTAAKITQCGHYFHCNCLRKWLYIQTTCPLCHQDVLVKKAKEN